jgi:SAM-dependent methyltransferase
VARNLRIAHRRLRILYRGIAGTSNTYWDRQDPNYLKNHFLRDPVDGIDHPARVYLREWLKKNPGLTLLDIPCGPGVEYEGFRKDNVPVKYIGMDFSETMLRAVKSRFPEADVREGNILDIALPPRSVDVVLCRHILEHLDDWRPAVREAIRVARRCVFIVLFRMPTHTERRAIGHGAYDNRLDWSEISAFIDSVGRETHVETLTLPYHYKVPSLIEENVVIRIDCQSEESCERRGRLTTDS